MTVNISKNIDKRARICKISYAFASDLIINNYPGDYIQVNGVFEDILFSSVSFSEIQEANGEQYSQELIIEIRGDSGSIRNAIRNLTGKYTILKMVYSNNEIKILGTDASPLMLVNEQSGVPVVNKLSLSRYSAEKAKHLLD